MVLSCSQFEEDLSALIDGELEEHRQTVLSEHMLACPRCRSGHDKFKAVGFVIKKATAQVQDKAPDLWEELAGRLLSVCQCVQNDLSAYLDGELLAPAKEGIDQHLEHCAGCLQKFQQLSQVNNLLSKGLQLPEEVNVDIWAGVKARLNDDCLVINSELSPFIDREVATLRHRAITSHLTECNDCTHQFNQLSETGDILRTYYQPQLSDDFDLWPAIEAQIKVVPLEAAKEKRRAPNPVRRLSLVAAAVVAGVLASVGFMWYAQNNQPQVQPVTAEAYLIDQSLGDPADVAEAVVYDHTP